MKPAILMVRVMQFTFIVSVLLFIYVLHLIHPAPHSVNASVQWSIVFCAFASALMGFIVQRMMLRAPSQSLPATQSSNLPGPWFTGHVVRFATAESVALFGFVLSMVGKFFHPGSCIVCEFSALAAALATGNRSNTN